MKNRISTILLTLTAILMITAIAAADGSYPIPQFYPIGQPNYTPPVNYYNGQTTSETPNYYQQPNQYYYPQQNPYNYNPGPVCGQPYYDPYSQQYYTIPCDPNQYYYPQPYQPQPWQPQPYQPQQQSNVEVTCRQANNGTVNVTWTIRNITSQDWNNKEVDILCTEGCGLLTGRTNRWDIPYWVSRNGTLSFTVNTRQIRPGDRMSFQIIQGSKVLYTFSVYPY